MFLDALRGHGLFLRAGVTPTHTTKQDGYRHMDVPNSIKFARRILIPILGLAFASGLGLVAAAERRADNYESRFIHPTNGVHFKDNNVWVYTSSFAKRFGMPSEWIDDSLKGAEAVAYRVEWGSLQECGFFRDENNCRPTEYCMADVYLTDAQGRKLPWKNRNPQGFKKRNTSVVFLSPQNREDDPTWDRDRRIFDTYRMMVGLDTLGWVSGPPRDGKIFSGSSDGVRVQSYDRDLFPGLDFLHLSVDCNFPTQKSGVRVFFMEKFPDRDDYGVSYSELREAKSPNAQRFLKIKDEWFRKHETGDVAHEVALPDAYMKRINAYDKKVYAPKSLATEVEKRLKGKGDK